MTSTETNSVGSLVSSLSSSFKQVPPAAIPPMLDCILASTGCSASAIFSSLLDGFPDLTKDAIKEGQKLDSDQCNYIASMVGTLCHLLEKLRANHEAFQSFMWEIFIPLMKMRHAFEREMLNQISESFFNVVTKTNTWGNLEKTLVPCIFSSVGFSLGMLKNEELDVIEWGSFSKGEINTTDMDKECLLSLSRSFTLPTSCYILTLILDAALRNLQAAPSTDSMLENGCCYAEKIAGNLLWDLCNMTERLLLQSVEHRSCAIGFLLPIILKAFVSLQSLEISVQGHICILSRKYFLKKIWKCCRTLFSLGPLERRDAYTVLSLYLSYSSSTEGSEYSDSSDRGEEFDIGAEKEFWVEIKRGLVDEEGLVRKQSLHILKAVLQISGKNQGHSSVSERKSQEKPTTIPAKPGSVVATANYVVTVGLGTPKKDLSLEFDTGSDLTWTQCEPCRSHCYQQMEPIFDPSVSKTYSNVSCSSKVCDSLESGTGFTPKCAGSTCVYGCQYGDNSYTVGFFAKETLTLTSSDIFSNFLFGCGQNNRGLFGKSAGLLGLGRDPISFISQTSQKYKKFFSYCLPSSSSSTGHLTFGKAGGLPGTLKFTPLSAATDSFYGLDIIALSVGGKKLPIPNSVFTSAGAIIDSGTVITRLPPAAYSALRSTFQEYMSEYPTAPAVTIFDTCYDFSNYTSVSVPRISFFFNRGVEVSIDVSGILMGRSIEQICLAFAGNDDDRDAAIIGNMQQKTIEVVYDVAGGRVGFAPKGCS